MSNIAIISGTAYFGDDVMDKLPFASYLSEIHEFSIASRINLEKHFNKYLKKIEGY